MNSTQTRWILLIAVALSIGLCAAPVAGVNTTADTDSDTKNTTIDPAWPDPAVDSDADAEPASNVSIESIDVDSTIEYIDDSEWNETDKEVVLNISDRVEAESNSTPSPTAGGVWPQFGANAQSTGYDSSTAIPSQDLNGDISFTTEIETQYASPVVTDETMYIGDNSGIFYAVDRDTGELRWGVDTGASILTAPAVSDDGIVYVGNNAGMLLAFDADSGDAINGVDTGAEVIAPAVDSNTVYSANFDGAVFALDETLSNLYWTNPVESPSVGYGVSAGNEHVYVGDEYGLYAFDRGSGERVWEFYTDSPVYAVPTVADGQVYVGSYNDEFHAIDADTGDPEWQRQIGRSFASPAVTDETVYVGTLTGNLVALDRSSGAIQWGESLGEEIWASPAAAENAVSVITASGQMATFEQSTGEPLWSVEYDPTLGSPAVADGALYVPNTGGSILRITGESSDTGPNAAFDYSPRQPGPDEAVTFDASASEGEIAEYRWDFTDDGQVDATGQTASYTFEESGTYQVTLAVVDENGDTDLASESITVEDQESTPDNVWSTFAHDMQRTGYGSEVAGPVADPNTEWSTGVSSQGSPVVSDGVSYAMTQGGSVIAIDTNDGSTLWETDIQGSYEYAAPTVSNGVVYAGTSSGYIYALNANDGSVLWERNEGNQLGISVTVQNNVLYTGTGDGRVLALDTDTGDLIWEQQTNDWVIPAPAIADGTVYVGSNDGHVYAFDAETGNQEWRVNAGAQVRATPAVADGTVYVGTFDWELSDNKLNTKSQSTSSPLTGENKSVDSQLTHTVYALDSDTGDQLWSTNVDGSIYASPAVTAERVTVLDYGGTVHALDRATGETVWERDVAEPGVHASSPSIAGDTTYVGTVDGRLLSFDEATGDTRWTHSVGEPIVSSPAIGNGNLYFGSGYQDTAGSFYKIDGEQPADGSTVYVESTDIAAGGTDTVSVGAENAAVAGYQTTITFDPGVVQVTGVEGVDIGSPTVNIDNTEGWVTLTASAPETQSNPVFADITFETIGNTGTQTELTFVPEETTINDQNGDGIEIRTYQDGEISVTDERAEFTLVDVEFAEYAAQNENITTTVTVENTGSVADTQTITYLLNGDTVAETSVSLDGGEQQTIPLDYTIPLDQEPGDTSAAVQLDGDSESGTTTIVQLGDVDRSGDISPGDATLVQRNIVGLDIQGAFYEPAADLNGDRSISPADATLVQRAIVGLPIPEPDNSSVNATA